MKFDQAKWEAAFRKAVADLKSSKPAAGEVCAIASIRYLRDSLAAGMAAERKDEKGKPLAPLAHMAAECNELIREISGGKVQLKGFASNGSSAAGTFGFKTEPATMSALDA